MKNSSWIRIAALSLVTTWATTQATEIFKANNNDPLNAGTSWTGGVAPGPADLATWGTIGTAANRTNSLGGDLSWGGLRVATPGGVVNLRAGNTLTLGPLGVIMTNASANLVLSNNVELGASQVWEGANSRNIFMHGVLSGAAGNTLTKAGSNRVDLAAANTFTGDVFVNAGQLRVVHPSGLGNASNVRVNTSIVGTAQDAGTQLALGTNVAPSGITLTMACTTNGGDFRTTLMCAGTTAGFSSGWNGPIVVTGDGSVHFHNNGAANSLVIAGNVTASNFTGTIRTRGGGSNAFLGKITIPSGDFGKHEAGPLFIGAPGNDWTSTAINNGTLILGANNALPPATVITLGNNANSGLLDLNGFSQQIGGLAISGTGGQHRIFSGSSTSDSTLVYGGAGEVTFPGSIGDNASFSPGTPSLHLTVSSGALALRPALVANSYGGTTTVKSGASLTIQSDHAGGGPVIVEDGGTFAVIVTAAGSSMAASSASFGTSSGCSLNLNLGSLGNPTAAPITTGTLSARGTVTLNLAGVGLLNGQFPLIAHGGSIGGSGFSAFKLGPLPPGVVSAYLSNNTASVDLVITLAAGSKLWTGASSGVWDINTSTNWINLATGLPDRYTENALTGDLVAFDDTSAQQTVNLTASVKPLITTFSNSLPYTLSGAGTIHGGGSLVKGGFSTLTINNANSFSGGSTLFEGLVKLGNSAALGTGPVTMTGGALSSDGATPRTLANSLMIAPTAVLGDAGASGALTINGVTDFQGGTRSVTCHSATVFAGGSTNGALNKYGAATLTLRGDNIFSAEAEVREATLVIEGTFSGAGTFRPDCETDGGTARLVVANGAYVSLEGTGNNLRAGYNAAAPASATATNIIDIAGTLRLPNATAANGRAILGRSCAAGILNLLSGGDLEVSLVRSSDGTPLGESRFNFNGGTLRPKANTTTFMEGLTNAYVLNGGAVIDTSGYDITIAQDLLADGTGGLTKNGLGTLTLRGANTFTGPIRVNGGSLVIAPAHAGGGAITVSDGATLGVPVNVGGPTLNASSLTLGSSGTTTIAFDFGSNPNPATALLNGGSVTANGSVKIDITASSLTAGTIPLLKYTSLGGGGYAAFSLGFVPRGLNATLQNNVATSTLELQVHSVDSLVWTGLTDDNWDINTTTNWSLTGSPATFVDGDAAVFDDSASGSTTVNLATTVAPRSVTVSNTAKPYTLQGANGIDGAATFTKTGNGLLTVATPNTYSGLTTVSAGQLKLGASNVLPDGAGRGNLIVNATLDLNGFSEGVNGLSGLGTVDNSGAVAAALTVGNADFSSTFSGTLQDSGSPLSLVKVGAGTLQLNGSSTHSGGVAVNAGTLGIASGAALGSGTLTLGGGTVALPGALTVTNLLAVSANNSRFTNLANTGVMVFNGGLDFLGGTRYVYFDNDTTLAGPLVGSGGIERKFGLTTLTFKSVTGDLTGNLEIREGDVVFDGVSITKSANGIRLVCMVTNGLGRLVLTNGSRISLTGTGQNVRVGSSSPNGEATATNIANIAGTVEFMAGAGSIQIGANCALAELNLLPGGVLRIQGVVPQQTTGIARWNFNGGVLSPIINSATFFEGLSEANVQAGGAIFDTAGFDITVNQSLLDGGGGGGLTKQGAGTLLLNSVNSYTGPTLVKGGVLGGNGTITGPVTVQAAGTLSPGAGIGTLTINNNLTLQGTTFIEVNQDTPTADQIVGVTTLTYGGTLVVTNLGTAALTNGSSFQFFTASSRNGAFAAVVPAPGPGLSWDTSRLTVDGTLAVKTGPATTPTAISATVTGNQLELSWPADHLGWRLEGQTNSLSVGLSANWSTMPGSTTTNRMSFPVNPAVPTVFFRLVYP